jgi:FkbM family methyltransferase
MIKGDKPRLIRFWTVHAQSFPRTVGALWRHAEFRPFETGADRARVVCPAHRSGFGAADYQSARSFLQNNSLATKSIVGNGQSRSVLATLRRWAQQAYYGRLSTMKWLFGRTGEFYYDFLGVRTRVSYIPLPKWAEGHVFGIPEPGEHFLHTRAEWLGLLTAIKEASKRTVVVELGAGWGPWLVAAHAAARQRGIRDIHLIGVEGCKEHADSMHQHFVDNDIPPERHTLIHGAIGPRDGIAWFPEIDPLTNWGQPVHYHPTPNMHTLTCMSLPTLLHDHSRVDLIHCDIQGGESEVLPAAIDTLNAKARRIVVATHSPLHDGTILALFRTNGWTLEAWDPWVVPEPDEAQRDGTQVWSNPRVPVVRGALARAWEVLRGRRA